MSNIEKIRQEIERRKELLTPHKGQGAILCREIIKQFDSLLSFIDTISQPIMKDDIIDEIRTEIERRFSEYNHDSNHHIQAAECASILSFIDSLPEEDHFRDSTKMVSKDLEEAADEYAISLTPCDQQEELNYFNSFIAGAKWMANQMPMPEDTVIFMKGVAEGRRLEREDRNDDNLPKFYGD